MRVGTLESLSPARGFLPRGGAALSIYKVGVPINTVLVRVFRFLPFFSFSSSSSSSSLSSRRHRCCYCCYCCSSLAFSSPYSSPVPNNRERYILLKILSLFVIYNPLENSGTANHPFLLSKPPSAPFAAAYYRRPIRAATDPRGPAHFN